MRQTRKDKKFIIVKSNDCCSYRRFYIYERNQKKEAKRALVRDDGRINGDLDMYEWTYFKIFEYAKGCSYSHPEVLDQVLNQLF